MRSMLILLLALVLCAGCGTEKPPPATELEALIVIGENLKWCAAGLFLIAGVVCQLWPKKKRRS